MDMNNWVLDPEFCFVELYSGHEKENLPLQGKTPDHIFGRQ